MMVRRGGGLVYAFLALLAVAAILSYQLYFANRFNAPKIPLPSIPQVVKQVVTFVSDAYGRASAHLTHAFNFTQGKPQWNVTATIYTNGTRLPGADLQATLNLAEIQYTAPQANPVKGPDQTLFNWDFTVARVSAGLASLTADVILQIINCGACANTTIKVPVELQVTASVA